MRKIISSFGFFTGIFYPLKAIQFFLKYKNLWQYLIVPIGINILVGIITYWLILEPSLNILDSLFNNLAITIENFIANLPTWLNFIVSLTLLFGQIVRVILILILLATIGFIIAQFGSILGSPWYGKLSEKIEIIELGELELIEVNVIQDILRAILFELKKIVLMIIVAIPLFLLNFVPSIGNLISLIGGFSLTIVIICLDFFDAMLERKRLKFREKLKFVFARFPASAGFGIVCLGLISIPLLNLIIVPLCVSAGTLLICDYRRKNKLLGFKVSPLTRTKLIRFVSQNNHCHIINVGMTRTNKAVNFFKNMI